MLTENMKLWHGLVIAMVSLVLQACLLVAINCLLSRHMAKKNEQLLKRARLQAPRPSPSQHHSPASQKMETRAERSTPVSEPHYRHGSDTSSDSSDTSDSASSSPPTCQATKDVNYTQVVFSATGGRRNKSALDYENIKEATDYVNVSARSHKHNL
ncbi:regulator of hemoglobinization and erythroid cell expansion protein isoform X1 [Desmodus rotundus]|uniref:regulator of hemoglobinization and erythroid cell expansion protein isoform X1 n=1 Tax=Desmodus rotundus TaxID=9430 RepID=UPI0023819249|nr:regulator of hemoglobinization and erythroid cell expansion protein isoform X1 [Desmodus rotundus]XP_045039405.2 regulator of hemoglobinization and erythroid cell expansion protein isoform X1 [Desmodus rotundus]